MPLQGDFLGNVKKSPKGEDAQGFCLVTRSLIEDKDVNITQSIFISNLTCADCAVSLEKSLKKIPDIKFVYVLYPEGKVKLGYSNEKTLFQIQKLITSLGYEIKDFSKSETFNIKIPEMDCSEEINLIKKALSSIEGIENIKFYPVNRKIVIRINPNKIKEVVKKIKGIGMSPEIIGSIKERHNIKISAIPLFFSLLFFIVALIFFYTPSIRFMSSYFFSFSIVIGGYLIFKRAFFSLLSKTYDMNLLMAVAVIGAIFLGEWFESSIVVLLFAVAQILENRSLERVQRTIKNLMDKSPDISLVNIENSWIEMPTKNVKRGQIIRIKPGEKISLDGIIFNGESNINQASITGESMPVYKKENDEVFAGTINQTGRLDVKVTNEIGYTALSKIVNMVEEAQSQKAPAQAFIDKFSKYYTPMVIVMAIFITTIPVIFFHQQFSLMIYRSLVLLLIACPCALVISTPVSILSGLSKAAKNGVLIKGGIHLENFSHVDTVVFDKTGTLTEGKPSVFKIIPFKNKTVEEVLQIASSIEIFSEHPLGNSIVDFANENSISILEADQFQAIPGMGAKAKIKGVEYFVGSHRHFCNEDRCNGEVHDKIVEQEKKGDTVVMVGDDNHIFGIIILNDILRENTEESIKVLKKEGIKNILMLTGDHNETARAIANKLEIDFKAQLLPWEKVQQIKMLQERGGRVAMVGDGINDAPALATSSVGIAMGAAGSDTAIEVSDIALLSENLLKIPFTLRLARKTLRIIKENIVIALSLKLIFFMLAILGYATLWMAIFADMGASLIVIFNGLKILKFK